MLRLPRSRRSVVAASVAAMGFLAVGLAALAWLSVQTLADTLHELAIGRSSLGEIQSAGNELDAQRLRVGRRLLAKDRIAWDLIDGRISLAEAARRVDSLPDRPNHFYEELRESEGGGSDAECMLRHIMDYACCLLNDDPARQAAVRRRLTAELHGADPRSSGAVGNGP
jgi:hypothetical protein